MTRKTKLDDELDAYKEETVEEAPKAEPVSFILATKEKQITVYGVEDISTPTQVAFSAMYRNREAGEYVHAPGVKVIVATK